METKDRIIKAKIKIQNQSPFFAYLSLFLKFKEAKEGTMPDSAGCGVDVRGNLYYKKEFIDGLSDEELKGVIIHEILHIGLLHLSRRNHRDPEVWNIACDICVNLIAVDNGYKLPKTGCIPYRDCNGYNFEICGNKLTDLENKPSEIVYEELKNLIKQKQKNAPGLKDGTGGNRFDDHMEEALTSQEKEEIEKEWVSRMEEAYVSAKMRGQLPSGIERLMGKIHEQKVDWRQALKRHIQSYIPYDFTYSRPNKKSISSGYYVPDYIKEKIKVVIAVDTSGSIGEKELTDFLSEIVGMAKAFQNRIDMHLITHDSEIHNTYQISNGNIHKIMNLKFEGGGGTNHLPVFDYIRKNIQDCSVAVFFTDGYSDLDEFDLKSYNFSKIFLLSNEGNDFQMKEENVIKL